MRARRLERPSAKGATAIVWKVVGETPALT
jgi:hypothetical protein